MGESEDHRVLSTRAPYRYSKDFNVPSLRTIPLSREASSLIDALLQLILHVVLPLSDIIMLHPERPELGIQTVLILHLDLLRDVFFQLRDILLVLFHLRDPGLLPFLQLVELVVQAVVFRFLFPGDMIEKNQLPVQSSRGKNTHTVIILRCLLRHLLELGFRVLLHRLAFCIELLMLSVQFPVYQEIVSRGVKNEVY